MKNLLTAVLVTVLAAGTFSAMAMPNGDRMERRLEMMTRNLDLSAEQQKQFKELFDAHMKQREAMRQEMDKQIKAILNDEQKARFDEFQEQRKQRWASRKWVKGPDGCNRGPGRHRMPQDVPPQQ